MIIKNYFVSLCNNKRVESNVAGMSRRLLTPMVSGSTPATRTKFLTMKYLILVLLAAVLFSCKSQKAGCDAYSSNCCDTTYITPTHYHIESLNKCVWTDSLVRK